jgi:hypothetical protein
LGGVLSAIGQTIDANKYEDFARAVLGNKAYLLFSFDKLIIAVSKFESNHRKMLNNNEYIYYRLRSSFSQWQMTRQARRVSISFRNSSLRSQQPAQFQTQW